LSASLVATRGSLTAEVVNSRTPFRQRLTALAAARALSSGNKARDQKRWGEAIETYSKVLRLRPDAANIWVQLGHCLKESGNAPEAEKAYLKGLELEPENADTLLHVGRIKRSMNDAASALYYLERAAGVPSPSSDAATELGELRSDLADRALSSGAAARDEGRWAEAVDAYKTFLGVRPNAADVWVQLGRCWRESGNPVAAEEACLKGLELDPEYPDALLELGRIKQSMNDVAAAERYFGRAAALRSPAGEAAQELRDLRSKAARLLSLGNQARDGRRWREAVDAYRGFLELRPNAADMWAELGYCLREGGDAVEAEKAFLRSQELDPKLPQPQTGLEPSELSKNAKGPASLKVVETSSRAPSERGEQQSPPAKSRARAFRKEISGRPQRPLPDVPGALRERASGRFLSEILSLPAGRYRARVQIMFSELANGEPVAVKVRRFATGRVLDEVELKADLNNRAVMDQIYLSFALDKQEEVEFYGWVGAHCETTLLRMLTVLDDPMASVVVSDFDLPAAMQPSIRQFKEVNFGTTGICNASCVHCPTNKKSLHRPHGTMTAALFEKIIRELADGGFCGQFIFGLFAEPLEDPLLLNRLKFIKQLLPECEIHIATNAALYDPRKHLDTLDYIDYLYIHVEAMTPEVYDRLMHPLKSDRVIPKINQIIEALRLRGRNNVNITTPVHKDNLAEVCNIADYARDNGANPMFTGFTSRAWEGGQYPKLSIAPAGAFCRPSALLNSLFIDYDGLVLPCCFDFSKSMPLGDLNRQTLNEIFVSEAWESMFGTFKRGEWSAVDACSRCRADDAGTTAELVNGLTCDSERTLRRFPAISFKSSASTWRNPSGAIVADEDAPDGILVYGPYVGAAPGRYRVYHDVQVLRASGPCALELDVCVDYGNPIAQKRIELSAENDFEAVIEFEHAKDAPLEFRVHKRGNMSFEHKGARLLRL
jgi:tetratricopeptide (TPR) repeat protein/MoaA/NifB/PqqE/SkfB family radical SAM enzyme